MKIQALDWTMGEVGNFFVGLKGGMCRIDWGDGHTSVIQAHPISLFLHIRDQCLIRYSLPAVSFQTIISGFHHKIVIKVIWRVPNICFLIPVSHDPEHQALPNTYRLHPFLAQ